MAMYPNDDDDWVLETHDLGTPASNFAELQSAVALWVSKRVDGNLPAWRDFDLEDFKGWYGWICVYDVIEGDPIDIHIRLWGTQIANLLGYDLTGKSIRTNNEEPYEYCGGYAQEDIEFFSIVRNSPAIGLTDGSVYWQNRHHVRYKEIFLPLAKNGRDVDSILGVTFYKAP